jgi:hypothetical protein
MEGCQSENSQVLMANGEWKNIQDIKVGDLVLSPQQDGTSIYAPVKELHKWVSPKLYSVREQNRQHKELYNCAFNHFIPINIKDKKGNWCIKNFEGFQYKNRAKYTRKNETTLTSFPIEKYKDKENCKIEPYSLGVYLGDGSFTEGCSLSITSADNVIIKEIEKYYPIMSSFKDKRKHNLYSYRYSNESEFAKLLNYYNLFNKRSGTKFIPKDALTSDIEYRKKLLSGMIDADGTLSKSCSYSITTKSKQLAQDINDLVYSIGGRAQINKIKKGIKKIGFIGIYYRVSLYLGKTKLYCKVKRKQRSVNSFYISPNRKSIELKDKRKAMVYGFTLDSPSHYYITDNWCITLNSGKTTIASAISKYLDPTFPGELLNDGTHRRHPERIVFSAEQFSDAVRKSKPKQAIQFDEAILALMAGDAGSTIQKMLMKEITLIRKKQLYIVLVIPSIFSMRMPIAAQRSRFLIHTYSPNGIDRGYFKFYNYPTKRQLYIKGKKDFNQDCIEADFEGSFADTEGLFYDHGEYDKKKEHAIRAIADSGQRKVAGSDEYKTVGQRNLLLYYIYTLLGDDQKGKEQLEKIVELHNQYATATKATEKFSVNKYNKWLKEVFGEHMSMSYTAVSDYLKDAVEYVKKPVKPIGVKFGEYEENSDSELVKDIPENDIPEDDTKDEE